jgi:nucleoside-diphosphate-sugar epimerase
MLFCNRCLHTDRRRHIDPGLDWFLKAAELLKNSKLTYTRPVCGAFMDFLGMPYARSNIPPMNIVIDILHREACIPGDGSTPLTMIHSYDAATLVAKLLGVDEWSEFSFCNGDDTTLSEVLRIAEEIRGRYLFLAQYTTHSN